MLHNSKTVAAFRRVACGAGCLLFLASAALTAQNAPAPAAASVADNAASAQATPAAAPMLPFPSDAPPFAFPAEFSPSEPLLAPICVVSDTATGESFITAALDFSLCPRGSAAYAAVLAKYRALEAAVTDEAFRVLPALTRAEQILALIYQDTLQRYSLKQTRLDVLFAEGVYNCVSASVLYASLAIASGLDVVGNLTPDHAFCSIYVDGKRTDVECTNPAGFNVDTKKLTKNIDGKTAYFIVPAGFYSHRVEVSTSMLLFAVGKNLASQLDQKDDYTHALPLLLSTLPCAQNAREQQTIRADLDVLCGNYSHLLNRQGKHLEAVAWLDSLYALYGESAPLRESYDTCANNALADYINGGDYVRAAAFLEAHGARMLPKTRTELDNAIFLGRADAELRALDHDAALERLRELRKDKRAQLPAAKKRFDELCEYHWYQKAKAFGDAKDYLAAARIADEGLRELPASRNLQALKKQVLQNHAVGYHNRFAALANAGNYEEALAVIQAGLAENPSSSILQKDLNSIKKLLGR